jgi:Leucine-rich repeat (LRR) protein
MKKNILASVLLLIASTSVYSQDVTIPDASFKAYLVGNSAINTNGDTEIQVSEASTFAGLINCSGQSISNLSGIEAFTSITGLDCASNQLISLDLSSNTALTDLYGSFNQITSIDLSNLSALEYLSFGSNLLTSLDVTNNTSLVQLSCQGNQLTSLTIGNTNITNNFSALSNPNLTCIQVVDVAFSTANWTNIDPGVTFNTFCSCIINVPDANFKAYLVGNGAINTNGDTEIQCNEANSFSGGIYCSAQSISDMTGLQEFTNLTQLDCRNNSLANLDVNNNVALDYLDCRFNSIVTIDLSNNTALLQLLIGNNSITALDVSNNSSLTKLHCYNNMLTVLDVTTNTALTELFCYFNSITAIDLTYNSSLTSIQCYDNSLSSLNIANGNNINLSAFGATNNPSLICIQVDDVAYSTTNWTSIDPQASFSTNCNGSASINAIEDAYVNIYPNPVQDQLYIDSENGGIMEVKIIDFSGRTVSSANEYTNAINVSDLKGGVYLVRVKTTNGMATKCFIKK